MVGPSTEVDLRPTTLLAGALAALLVAGCTDAEVVRLETGDPLPSDDAASAPATAAPDARPPGDAPDVPAPAPPEPVRPDPEGCTTADRDEMSAAVRGQLAAIRDDDWAGALDFTSTAFRAGVDEDRFERIIVDDFPVVADGVAADVAGCTLGAETVATMLVTVEDVDGTQQVLIYLFEREPAGWRIGGAVPAEDGAGDEPAITA